MSLGSDEKRKGAKEHKWLEFPNDSSRSRSQLPFFLSWQWETQWYGRSLFFFLVFSEALLERRVSMRIVHAQQLRFILTTRNNMLQFSIVINFLLLVLQSHKNIYVYIWILKNIIHPQNIKADKKIKFNNSKIFFKTHLGIKNLF